ELGLPDREGDPDEIGITVMQHMRAAGDAQCTPFPSLCRSLVGWPDGLDCGTDRHACSKRDDAPVDRERSLCSVFLAYPEDYRVDVKFVCDRIGTILFDHLVGAGKQRGWDGETDRLGSLEVDHELELGRLQHRKVAGLLPLQDAADGEAGRP